MARPLLSIGPGAIGPPIAVGKYMKSKIRVSFDKIEVVEGRGLGDTKTLELNVAAGDGTVTSTWPAPGSFSSVTKSQPRVFTGHEGMIGVYSVEEGDSLTKRFGVNIIEHDTGANGQDDQGVGHITLELSDGVSIVVGKAIKLYNRAGTYAGKVKVSLRAEEIGTVNS
ncbi:MAG: hypothetical protein Q8S73_41325 [Deltaproteobacteria bacterium]|nr:hypothetical protein [Myxococcales bacterium]MDP3220603.1 hypothetical protein [Deltaproteobacteria bacterium]